MATGRSDLSGGLLRALVRDMPTAVLVLDAEGAVVMANPAARRMLSASRGRLLVDRVDADDAARVHEFLASLLRGRNRSVHLEKVRLSGVGDRWVTLDGRAVRMTEGFRGAVVALQDVTSWVELVADVTLRSFTDPLTGLDNRRSLDEAARRTHRSSPAAVFVIVDVDRFKEVNDRFGHRHGDELLVELARRLKGVVGEEKNAAFRIGGDEFALIAREGGEAAVAELVQRLAVISAEPYRIQGAELVVTVSAGIAINGGRSPHEWMARADAALYRAKGERGGAVLWDDELRHWRSRRMDMESELEVLRAEVSRLTETSRTDFLTQLPNVRALYQDLDSLLHTSPNGRVGLVFIDLDMFGSVNKARGDSAGDAVLARVAEVFRSSCRGSDVVYRKGGEEFVVVLADADEVQTVEVAERFRVRLVEAAIPHGGRPDMPHVTLSAGTASGLLTGKDSVDVLMRTAAGRMLLAKQAGRDRVVEHGG